MSVSFTCVCSGCGTAPGFWKGIRRPYLGIFPLDSFKFVLKAFPCHEILVPTFKFCQIVHGSLFYNLPISLLSASYTFQQAKLLKAGKVVLYAVLRNVRKTFTYLLSGCFRMFFYEWQHSLLLFRQVLNGLLGSLLVALSSSPFWILKLKSRPNARSIIAELRRGETVILTSRDDALARIDSM